MCNILETCIAEVSFEHRGRKELTAPCPAGTPPSTFLFLPIHLSKNRYRERTRYHGYRPISPRPTLLARGNRPAGLLEKCTDVRFLRILRERTIWSPAARRPRCGGYIGPTLRDCQQPKFQNMNFLCSPPPPAAKPGRHALFGSHFPVTSVHEKTDAGTGIKTGAKPGSGFRARAGIPRFGPLSSPVRSGQSGATATTKTFLSRIG